MRRPPHDFYLIPRVVLLAFALGGCNDATETTSTDASTDASTDTSTDTSGTTSDDTDGPSCGDGIVDEDEGEACDDGNDVDLDGCNDDCQVSGELQWEASVTVDEWDIAVLDALVVTDEAIFVGGRIDRESPSDALVARLSFDGVQDWAIAEARPNVGVLDMSAGPSGDLIVLTHSNPILELIARDPADGTITWEQQLDLTWSPQRLLTEGDELVIVGMLASVDIAQTPAYARYDQTGALIEESILTEGDGLHWDAAPLASGGFLATGEDQDDLTWLRRYADAGAPMWEQSIVGGVGTWRVATQDDDIWLWGSTNTAGHLQRYSNTGELTVDIETDTGALHGQAQDVCVDAAGYPVVLGRHGTNGNTFRLEKRDPEGALVWSHDEQLWEGASPPDGTWVPSFSRIDTRATDRSVIVAGTELLDFDNTHAIVRLYKR